MSGAPTPPSDMGEIPYDELIAALVELLEAERAGARVALASVREAPNPAHAALMDAVRRDEASWCAMLMGQIERFGALPSRKTGAFYGKAMAIADPFERLAFLNRGQSWVVRKLEALMPRVSDDSLRGDLHAMLESHRINIDLAETLLSGDRSHPSGSS